MTLSEYPVCLYEIRRPPRLKREVHHHYKCSVYHRQPIRDHCSDFRWQPITHRAGNLR